MVGMSFRRGPEGESVLGQVAAFSPFPSPLLPLGASLCAALDAGAVGVIVGDGVSRLDVAQFPKSLLLLLLPAAAFLHDEEDGAGFLPRRGFLPLPSLSERFLGSGGTSPHLGARNAS